MILPSSRYLSFIELQICLLIIKNSLMKIIILNLSSHISLKNNKRKHGKPPTHHLTLLLVAQIRFILLQNRQGKTRLSRWYVAYNEDERKKIEVETHRTIVSRDNKMTSFLEVSGEAG